MKRAFWEATNWANSVDNMLARQVASSGDDSFALQKTALSACDQKRK
jgi:hypothetical protein